MSWTPASRQGGSARIATGTVLNGMFAVDSFIGAGGMGEIYRGHAIQTGDVVAIKLIRTDLAENEDALALFRKEASILHNLLHEAIVRYYVVSVDPQIRRPYLVMEFVDGPSLSDLMAERPLAFEAVRSLQRRLAGGLQAAHALGIVHRDISPDNIILPGGDVTRAKIIDFGIARAAAIGGGTVIGGGFAGKQNYVSPEQLGLFGGEVTAKSDIYSMGLVLAGALAGRPIDMDGNQAEIVEKRRSAPDLGGIDARLRPLIARMVAPRPEDRPASMAEVADWVPGVAPGSASGASRSAGVAKSPPARLRTRTLTLIVMSLASSAAIGTLAALYGVDRFLKPPGLDAPEEPASLPPIREGASNRPQQSPDLPPQARLPPPPPELPPPAQPAALPRPPATRLPVPPPQPPGPPTRAQVISDFIGRYEGGACFFATLVDNGVAPESIAAYTADLAKATALDERFKTENPFEVTTGVRQVAPQQCAAVDFLRDSAAGVKGSPRIALEKDRLRGGDPLTGAVTGYADGFLQLFLVSHAGLVYDVIKTTTAEAAGSRIYMQTDQWKPERPEPFLLLAVATAKPLDLPDSPVPAGRFFPGILAEAKAASTEMRVAVRYLVIGG